MNVFHTPQTSMTPEEAEAVVRRHLERTPEAPTGPTVADMAEVLHLSPEEVATLLAEVRASPRKKRAIPVRERRMWLLSGALALAIGVTALGAMVVTRTGPFRGFETNVVVQNGPGVELEPFNVAIDGTDYGSLYYDDQKGTPSQELPKLVRAWLREHAPRIFTPQSYSLESSNDAIAAAKAGEWAAIQGVKMSTFELKKPTDNGPSMRWVRAVVPIYNGDDSLVADAVERERTKRIAKAVETAMKGIPPPTE